LPGSNLSLLLLAFGGELLVQCLALLEQLAELAVAPLDA
jgi:hypothetical protein